MILVLLILLIIALVAVIFCCNRWRFFKNCGADSFRFLSVADIIEILDGYDIQHRDYTLNKRNEVYSKLRSKAVPFSGIAKAVRRQASEIYNELTEEG